MTRSKAPTTKAGSIAIAALLLMGLLTGIANAGRKRIVVLEFEGDKAEKFHADVVKLIKKSHTVVSTDKWNGAAEEMSATKLNEKNVKKLAKKLNVDGVVSGVVEKRRDEYILRLKLRSGVSGEIVGSQINIKSESARLDSTAVKDVKEELIDVIAGIPSNRPSDDEEEAEEEKPKKSGFGKKKADEEEEAEEEKPKKSGFGKKKADEEEEEEKPKKTAAAKKAEDEAAAKKAKKAEEDEKAAAKARKADDEAAAKKAKKAEDEEKLAAKAKKAEQENKPKKVKKAEEEEEEEETEAKVEVKAKGKDKRIAKRDDEEEDNELEGSVDVKMDSAMAYSPSERAVDAVIGMSFTGRRMSFTFDRAMVTNQPAGYKQFAPVPGVLIDATVYPLAFGHKRKDLLRGLGVTVLFDQAVGLKSEAPGGGAKQATTEQRIAFGAVMRYPLGKSPTAPVVGGSLTFNKQKFNIAGEALIPNVNYSMLEPEVFFIFPLGPKVSLNLDAGLMLMLDAGQVVKHVQYGQASITGIEASVGVDYMLTKTIFARAMARLETLGYAFKGDGEKSMGVTAARDTYFGGTLTAGYLF